ncbi:hypothetical protein M422DRAFT_45603 [Sphaerobolus stellatus SS14]|uniref:Uncharacterized protein n=1 Tax=Sphaerobolus stellatus (strain SS14) TaxID=990650 RepID=A0A0C9W4P5_SPHS4|nr:hypothetical protein M422DRAFT_45603 [Sphaerobolus stellatus SS14]
MYSQSSIPQDHSSPSKPSTALDAHNLNSSNISIISDVLSHNPELIFHDTELQFKLLKLLHSHLHSDEEQCVFIWKDIETIGKIIKCWQKALYSREARLVDLKTDAVIIRKGRDAYVQLTEGLLQPTDLYRLDTQCSTSIRRSTLRRVSELRRVFDQKVQSQKREIRRIELSLATERIKIAKAQEALVEYSELMETCQTEVDRAKAQLSSLQDNFASLSDAAAQIASELKKIIESFNLILGFFTHIRQLELRTSQIIDEFEFTMSQLIENAL